MKITRKHLADAAIEGILTAEQAEQLHVYLKGLPTVGPSFNLAHILYYLGGLIAIGAMMFFMNLGWGVFGGWGLFFVSLVYAGIGLKLCSMFQNKGYAIPAGVCAAFVVALTPLAIYGLQQALGLWPYGNIYQEYYGYINWHRIYIELGTLLVGAIIAWRYKYPFLVMPIAVTLWFTSTDIAIMLAGENTDFEAIARVSMYFGLLMTLGACWVDFKFYKTADYAFWLYIFGVMAFWGGLTAQSSDNELYRFLYFCINILLIGIGVMVVRRVFVVFGVIGACVYLGHLAWDVFLGSGLLPIALTAIGLLIIYLGILWQRNEKALTEKAQSVLPRKIKAFLESRDV